MRALLARPLAVLLILCSAAGCGAPATGPHRGPLLLDLVEAFPESACENSDGERPAGLDRGRGLVYLPFGCRVDYYLRLPGTASLYLDRLGLRGGLSRGGEQPTLAVLLQPAGGEERQAAQLESSTSPQHVELAAGDGGIVRLSLASGSEKGNGEGGFVLVAPRLHGPAGEPEAAPPAEPVPGDEETPEQPNIVVYLVDALRRDHLGVYGYPRPVSPNIDRFAAEATVFDRALAQSSWTRSSVASLLTGLEPQVHGVNGRDDALPVSAQTAAELLAAAGYHTAAVITNGNVGQQFGFEQGFDHFSRSRKLQHRSDQVNERVLQFLESASFRQPFFLYVHTMDPHHPYQPPESFRQRFAGDSAPELGENETLKAFRKGVREPDAAEVEQVVSLYDAEVASNDHYFGELLELLRSRGLYESTLVIFLSDHGEEFWEHANWGHGHTLYREVLDIPLIIREPRQRDPRRVSGLVQHVDLLPTMLDYAGAPAPPSLPGVSLRRARNLGELAPLTVFSVLDLDGRQAASLTEVEWKLIEQQAGKRGRRPEIFHLASDPGEETALHDADPVVVGFLTRLLREREARRVEARAPSTAVMDDELVEELKALGYLQ